MKKIINLNLYKEKRLEKSYKDIKTIFNDNIYLFILDNVKTSLSSNLFTRETEEYKFTLDIKKKEAIYILKEKNMSFDIEVEKINLKQEENNIILEYKLSSDESNLKIELIVKDENNE